MCVDDCTRLAYVEVLADERSATVCGFLERAVAWFALARRRSRAGDDRQWGGYRSYAHAAACRRLGVRHLLTEPYRPRTNGKAERFIRTLVGAGPTEPSTARAANGASPLPAFLDYYNNRRPHRSLSGSPPA